MKPQDRLPNSALAQKMRREAEGAAQLETIKKAVEDAASVSGPLWLSYLFALFYIALAAAGVTHKDLLLENPVELPFLNIKLALKAFFILAPIILVISHAYTMAHFSLLADKARLFHESLRNKIVDHDIREARRQQLPINMFVQFLAGPRHIRKGPFSGLLWVMAWTTLVGGPILVLLLLLVQFLPYHDTRVTWFTRIALVFELWIHWSLWMKILSGVDEESDAVTGSQGLWTKFLNFVLRTARMLAAPLTIIVALFSWGVATYPGEWSEFPYNYASRVEPKWLMQWRNAATEFVFGKVDALNNVITGSWPTNTLRLREFNIYEALKVDDPKKLEWKERPYDLQHRHLEQADLRFAKLGRLDLRDAHLEGSLLDFVDLAGASFDNTHLQSASLKGAKLQGATLNGAQLQGASLSLGLRQGGPPAPALLQGASLEEAHLEGALLDYAQLQGASLNRAQVQGATFNSAQLQGAHLEWADLTGASLDRAYLLGASFIGSVMITVSMNEAIVWRADLRSFKALESVSARRLIWGAETEKPGNPDQTWTEDDYNKLKEIINHDVQDDNLRKAALERIERLNCEGTNQALAPCALSAKAPNELRQHELPQFEKALVEPADYQPALACSLIRTIFSAGPDQIFVLRGVTKNGRLAATGGQVPALISKIVNEKECCPVSAALTEDDKARLLQIKTDVEKAQEEAAKAKQGLAPSAPLTPPKKPKK